MENQEIETIGTALPAELERCRELKKVYEEIGAPGRFVVQALDMDIQAAEKARDEGDVAAMVIAYRALVGWKE